ncbi:hypothetical protein NDU88_004368 [Pleurodeles waltl]|uniref:Uncharacterized protein n=1 Tax=Pleurodeles waltl TaxID=8319 RepID=A0AAV7T7F9_PLEWA|nr:hypothetical protein NDU88_004368 [Pleurodeles waltl]
MTAGGCSSLCVTSWASRHIPIPTKTSLHILVEEKARLSGLSVNPVQGIEAPGRQPSEKPRAGEEKKGSTLVLDKAKGRRQRSSGGTQAAVCNSGQPCPLFNMSPNGCPGDSVPPLPMGAVSNQWLLTVGAREIQKGGHCWPLPLTGPIRPAPVSGACDLAAWPLDQCLRCTPGIQ